MCQATGTLDISSNAFVDDAWEVKGERLVYMNARGPGCFDFKFYLAHNPGELELCDYYELTCWQQLQHQHAADMP